MPLLFPHIPKCAGTSFIRLLARWFGDEYHRTNKLDKEKRGMPKVKTKNWLGQWIPKVKVIHAHFDQGRGYGLPEYYPDIPQYMALYRDPFDIVVSMYFFAKGKSEQGEFFYNGEQIDIRTQYPSIEHYVNDYPGWLYNHLPQDVTLENYSTKIHEKFVYIGLLEDLQTSLDRMAEIFGKPREKLPLRNTSEYSEKVPETLRNRFYDEHPLLLAYYNVARETYRLAIEELPMACA